MNNIQKSLQIAIISLAALAGACAPMIASAQAYNGYQVVGGGNSYDPYQYNSNYNYNYNNGYYNNQYPYTYNSAYYYQNAQPSYYQTFQSLSGNCYPTPSPVHLGDTVTWFASVTGGYGNYTFLWNGSENLAGNTNSIYKKYTTGGNKNATVQVQSGNLLMTITCSALYVNDTGATYLKVLDSFPNTTAGLSSNTLDGACAADISNAAIGDTVVWTFIANQPYSNIVWAGTDGITSTGAVMRAAYDTPGSKSAIATVTWTNGTQSTKICSNTVTVKSAFSAYTAKNKAYKSFSSAPATTAAKTSASIVPAVAMVANASGDTTLTIACLPNASTAKANETVAWLSTVSGGNGTYQYAWSGTDGLTGANSSIRKAYSESGLKTATLTIASGDQVVTQSCTGSVNVTSNLFLAASSIVSFQNISWGLISVILIIILLLTVAYLLFNKSKM